MARKRHGGLGRGLDALIPQARHTSPEPAQEHSDRPETDPGTGNGNDQEKNQNDPEGIVKDAASAGGTAAPQAALQKEAEIETPSREMISGETLSGRKAVDQGTADGNGPDPDAEGAGWTGAGPAAGSPAGGDHAVETDSAGPGGVRMLRLSQVDPNRSQPRQKFEDEALEELADSIRHFGVLQPILVQKKGSRYEIIAGERRWRAARKAELKEIPAIVKDYSDQETLELSLIENIQREDLNPIEEAKAFKRLLEEFGLRQEDLAARVSKSRTAITNSVRLLKLDERVQEMVVQEQISMGHARALIPVEIPEEQVLIAQQIAERHLSVRDVEKLIKKRMADRSGAGEKNKKKKAEKDPALELAYKAIEERLKQALGTKASIRSGGDGTGRVEIEFYSHEDLEKIVDLLT